MLALVPLRDHSHRRFAEVRTADRATRHGDLLAIGCEYPWFLDWPGRYLRDGRALAHRVALYGPGDRLIAVCDRCAYPINDLVFHPTEPVLAIATGAYDGGYSYRGELLLWNWETGEVSELLEWPREIRRLRYERDGRLAVLAMPADDEDETSRHYGGTFTGAVRDADLIACTAEDLGFESDVPALDPAVQALFASESRAVIWDLAWTFDGRIAVARDDGVVELWSGRGEREHALRIGGRIVQLLRQPTRLVAHVSGARSELYILDGDRLEPWLELAARHACSVDATGRILARHIEGLARRDQIVSADGVLLLETNLGHYDSFNHFIRIDGAPELFYLRGTPADSHEHKVLCAIDRADVSYFAELPWDIGEHRMASAAILLDGDLVCSYRTPADVGPGAKRIERRTPAGERVWAHEVSAVTSALIPWPAVSGIVAALIDGTLCVLDVDGGVLYEAPFEIDGVMTIPTALAVHEETLVVGTIDGRLSLLSLR